MPSTEYVPVKEVQRVCKKLGIKDWTSIKKEKDVTKKDATVILKIINSQKMDITVEDFRQGLEVELEHGTRFADANITNNHPILTGKIVLAHLKESMDYYKRIDVAEIEGDLLGALLSKDLSRIESKYKKLIGAQEILNKSVADQLKKAE